MALGRCIEYFEFPGGKPAAHLHVQIMLPDTLTLAELFTDIGGTTPLANPPQCDSYGNLDFVAEEGDYDAYPEFGGKTRLTVIEGTIPGPPGPPGVIPSQVPVRLFYDADAGEYPARAAPADVASVEWIGPADQPPPEARPGFDTWIKV